MTLPADVTRCVGSSTDEGELVPPCDRCRRVLEAKPLEMGVPWMLFPPLDRDGCLMLLEVDQ